MTRHAMFIVGVLACGACGSTSTPTPTAPGPVATVQELRITAPSVMNVGHAAAIHAVARLSDGTERPVSEDVVTWHTATPTVVTLSRWGLVSAIHAGTATVWGTHQGVTSDAVSITVAPALPPLETIAVGETIEDALTTHGTSRAFRFTAPSNGTLVVQVNYDRTQGLVELNLEGQQIYNGPPTIGRLPVVAGRTYTITIADGAPWDYDTLYLRFAVTVSME